MMVATMLKMRIVQEFSIVDQTRQKWSLRNGRDYRIIYVLYVNRYTGIWFFLWIAIIVRLLL